MARRNIYVGTDSCYYRQEGILIPEDIPWVEKVVRVIDAILRDLRRGYTYDHSCRRIPMDRELAKRRLIYLIALTRKHQPEFTDYVRKLVRQVLETWSLPPHLAKLSVEYPRAVLVRTR